MCVDFSVHVFLCSPPTETDSNSEATLSIVSDKSTPFTRTPATSRPGSQHGSYSNLDKFRQDIKVLSCVFFLYTQCGMIQSYFSSILKKKNCSLNKISGFVEWSFYWIGTKLNRPAFVDWILIPDLKIESALLLREKQVHFLSNNFFYDICLAFTSRGK